MSTPSTSTISALQLYTSKYVILHGFGMMLASLVWGLVIENAPHPRIALLAHIEMGVYGMYFAIAGMLIYQNIIRVGSDNSIIHAIIRYSASTTWAMLLAQCYGSLTGAGTSTFPLVARHTNAKGGSQVEELIILSCHLIPGFIMIGAWIILFYYYYINTFNAPAIVTPTDGRSSKKVSYISPIAYFRYNGIEYGVVEMHMERVDAKELQNANTRKT